MQTIQIRHVGHCWRSGEELISNVLLWTPSHGWAKAGQPARTYIQQLYADTGCRFEDLLGAMDDRDGWWERVREICAGSATWWWWYICICEFKMSNLKLLHFYLQRKAVIDVEYLMFNSVNVPGAMKWNIVQKNARKQTGWSTKQIVKRKLNFFLLFLKHLTRNGNLKFLLVLLKHLVSKRNVPRKLNLYIKKYMKKKKRNINNILI